MTENPIKIMGVKRPVDPETRILSQNSPPPETPQILDKRTKQQPEDIEVVVHEDVITEADEVRRQQRMPGDPEVRVRHSDGSFEKIRRGEDD